jgi:Predicted transcriptional regulator
MSDNTLIISIGDMDDDFADVINVWESGAAVAPLNRLTFESMTGFLSFLTPKRWELVTVLRKHGHISIKKLSEILKRDYKNTHTDVKAMQEISLIEKDDSDLVYVPWDDLDIKLNLKQAA